MPRGKKEPAEQIIPYATSVEVEVGRGISADILTPVIIFMLAV